VHDDLRLQWVGYELGEIESRQVEITGRGRLRRADQRRELPLLLAATDGDGEQRADAVEHLLIAQAVEASGIEIVHWQPPCGFAHIPIRGP
jgi:hypothetical protein